MAGVLIPTSTEEEWLAARTEGITASEIAVVLGLSPFDSPFALYHRKRGDLATEDNESMRIGRHLESLVCEMFSERYPGLAAEGDGRALYRHPDRPWQMATPDRLLFDADQRYGWPHTPESALGVLEAKTAASYEGWGDDGSDEIPVHYRCQVLQQMDVMGTSAAYVACLFLHSRKLRVYELAMDDDAENDLKLMREEAELFLARHLRAGVEPDVDWRPATGEALRRLHPDLEDRDVTIPRGLTRRYRAACASVKLAEKRKALTENMIRARLGNGRRALDSRGEVVATRQVYDVKEHVRKACTVNKLVPAKTTEESR